MSMISAQIDKLRQMVGDGSMEWVAGPVRASVLREAADTIWELRDDLQRANAALQDAEHDESMAWDRVRKAESENAKLRGWWTHDGTWHVELPKLPEGIAVLTPDSHDRDVRTARAWRYVRDDNAENAKLREELAKARDPQRIGGQADQGSFAYAIEQLREFRWQHATNDEDAIPYINNVAAAHERESDRLREEFEKMDAWHSKELSAAMAENEKLRELVRDMRTCIGHACMCEFCPLFVSEDMNERRCIADMEAHMRELGVDDG